MNHPQEKWIAVCNKYFNTGIESLTENEKIWFNLRSIIDSFENGGLISYFYNHGANDYYSLLESLESVNQTKAIEILNYISNLFPGNEVPKDIDKRNFYIDQWDGNSDIEAILKQSDNEFLQVALELEKSIDLILNKIQ